MRWRRFTISCVAMEDSSSLAVCMRSRCSRWNAAASWIVLGCTTFARTWITPCSARANCSPSHQPMRDAARMQAVQSPIIPVVAEWIRSCPGTISLGQGVVSYGPPPSALAKIAEFLKDPENNKYKPVVGLPQLHNAIAEKLAVENGVKLNEQNALVVTAGGNMGFMNAVLALTDPGDEVVLQTPYYFNHEMAVTMASCRPVLVATDEEYQLRPNAIAEAITPRTRAVVTISPNNPTGAVYSEAALRDVNRICRERGVYHFHDEAYDN